MLFYLTLLLPKTGDKLSSANFQKKIKSKLYHIENIKAKGMSHLINIFAILAIFVSGS